MRVFKYSYFLLISFVFFGGNTYSFAQLKSIKGIVYNSFTKEPVPYASIHWQKAGFGVLTDSAGCFTVKRSTTSKDSLTISYVGFVNLYKPIQNLLDSNNVIYLNEGTFNTEVLVKSKFNKGLRWWKNIVAHKVQNNPYKYNNYSYELYNKLELDLNNIDKTSFKNIKLLKQFEFILGNIDSVSESKPFLPVFLTESLSDYYYSNNPYKVREEIKAIETNGIKNETVLQFVGGISQKINIYQEYIKLFDKDFISPISSIGDRFYNYKGADTQTINKDKYYHLFFTPKQEGTNTFTGDCWIHSKTWALQKINITASSSANINFVKRLSVVQEFTKLNDTTWMFFKDKFVAELSTFKKDKFSFIGRKTATYKNVEINNGNIDVHLQKNKTKEEVVILERAKSNTRAFWELNRHEGLNNNEIKVYSMIDTLNKMPLFKQYSNGVNFLVGGYKQYGKIEIGPWFKWFSGNQLERLRLRFDIGTTPKFSKHLKLNGYLAYGFRDAIWKGKAAINYKINKHESWNIGASYLNDLDNGRIHLNDEDATMDNAFSQVLRRQNIRQKFLGIQEWKLAINKQISPTLSAQTSFSRTDYTTFNPLPGAGIFSIFGDEVINSELGLKIRFAPGEKTISTKRRTLKIKGDLPVFEGRVGFGLPNVFKSEYNYKKFSMLVSQTIKIPRWGKIDYIGYAGKYYGKQLPFMVLEVHPGNEIYYYSKNAFNLMNRFEYISDAYAGFNIEHNFDKKLINLIPFLRKTKIRQFWNVKTVWGDLSDDNRKFNRLEFSNYRLKILRAQRYTELGTGVDNIFKFFRIDLVWRFNPTFNVPANSTLLNNPQQFGVFGSFKLQF